MNEPSVERPIARLRETATRIAPAREPAVLMDEVLAAATDPFFAAESQEASPSRYRERFGRFVSPAGGEVAADLAEKVAAALAGERVEVPLDLSRATPFQRRVLGGGEGRSPGAGRAFLWGGGGG